MMTSQGVKKSNHVFQAKGMQTFWRVCRSRGKRSFIVFPLSLSLLWEYQYLRRFTNYKSYCPSVNFLTFTLISKVWWTWPEQRRRSNRTHPWSDYSECHANHKSIFWWPGLTTDPNTVRVVFIIESLAIWSRKWIRYSKIADWDFKSAAPTASHQELSSHVNTSWLTGEWQELGESSRAEPVKYVQDGCSGCHIRSGCRMPYQSSAPSSFEILKGSTSLTESSSSSSSTAWLSRQQTWPSRPPNWIPISAQTTAFHLETVSLSNYQISARKLAQRDGKLKPSPLMLWTTV